MKQTTDFEARDLFIHFRDLVLYILLRWKSILLVALAGAVLLGAVRFWQDTQRYNAALAAEREDALTEMVTELTPDGAARVALVQGYQKAYDSICAYNADAPLMKIDFMAAPTRQMTYLVTGSDGYAAACLLRQCLEAEDLYSRTADPITEEQKTVWPAYYADLVTVELEGEAAEGSGTVLLNVEIVAPTDELCEQLSALVRDAVAEVDTSLSDAVKEYNGQWVFDRQTVRYSERVYLRQQDSLTQQKQVQTDLNSAMAALTAADREFLFTADHEDEPDWTYPAPTVNVVYVLLGFLAGGVVMVLWYALRYLFCGRVLSEADVAVRHGVTVFGSVAGDGKPGALRRWLQDKDADLPLLCRQVALAAKAADVRSLYTVGDVSRLPGLAEALQAEDITLHVGSDLTADVTALDAVAGADALLLAVQAETDRHQEVAATLALASQVGCQPLGVIVLK